MPITIPSNANIEEALSENGSVLNEQNPCAEMGRRYEWYSTASSLTTNPINIAADEEDEFQASRTINFINKFSRFEEWFVVLKNRPEIEKFLDENQQIINDVILVVREAYRVFQERNISELSLILEQDPEEDFQELFLLIKTALPYQEAMDIFEKLEEDCYLKLSFSTRKLFNVDVKFI